MLYRIAPPESQDAAPKSWAQVGKPQRLVVSWVLILLAIGLAMPVLSRTLVEVSYIGRASDRWATIAFNTVAFGWPSLALVHFAWRVRRRDRLQS